MDLTIDLKKQKHNTIYSLRSNSHSISLTDGGTP